VRAGLRTKEPGLDAGLGEGKRMTNAASRELEGKCILITGGTVSLGQVLVRRLLTGERGTPAKVIVFSRDAAKQHYMRLDFQPRSGWRLPDGYLADNLSETVARIVLGQALAEGAA
jgi:NAD(P)-dependent dehydrogenase (short-subunit alcohol dehydrogenase family)